MAEPQRKTTAAKKASGARAKPTGSRPAAKTTAARSRPAASRSTAKKKPAARSRSASARSTTNARSTAKKPAARARSTARPSAAKRRSASNGAPSRTPASSNGRGSDHGITDAIRDVASRAKGPAVAVGAAAAGVAGGIAIRNRTRRRTVLGVPVPKHLPSVDAGGIVKSVSHATKQFAKTSKTVSRDIERAGNQAERIGKILG